MDTATQGRMVWLASKPEVLERAIEHFREWWPKRHGHHIELSSGEQLWIPGGATSRENLRSSIHWIRFCRAAAAVQEPQRTYYEQERLEIPEGRWEDDGGALP